MRTHNGDIRSVRQNIDHLGEDPRVTWRAGIGIRDDGPDGLDEFGFVPRQLGTGFRWEDKSTGLRFAVSEDDAFLH
jgi:hypothetical protein